jgi:hypothetical protein
LNVVRSFTFQVEFERTPRARSIAILIIASPHFECKKECADSDG